MRLRSRALSFAPILALGVVLVVAAGCDSSSGGDAADVSSGGGPDIGWTPQDTAGGDPVDVGGGNSSDVAPDRDTGAVDPTDTTVDVGGGGPDVQDPGGPDIQAGDGAFGDPCTDGADCQSGLCWATTGANACTVECQTDQDCTDAGISGLECQWLREGIRGCAAPTMGGNPTCTSHGECRAPFVCRTDYGWCGLPECTWDHQCADGQHCNLETRKCENDVCATIIECTNPTEFCIDGLCGPPACTESAQCPTGEVCHMTSGDCRPAPACSDEGTCEYYNEVCIDGLCAPNLCPDECANPAATCDPGTGVCHLPCDAGCPDGQICDPLLSRCYQNHQPYAVPRARKAGQLLPVADIPLGTAVELDGSLSADPDGGELTFDWRVDVAPPAGGINPGDAIAGAATASFTPAAPGTYRIGLVVTDAGGMESFPAVVVVFVY